jgi:protein-S-isoprenylcysteine O-methyltransferase Ste14
MTPTARSIAALMILVLFAWINLGWRVWRHWRATGATGIVGVSGSPGSPEWFAGVIFVLGSLCVIAAPLADLGGVTRSIFAARPLWIDLAGVGAGAAGIAGVWWAQRAMGPSWRIGVDSQHRTDLVQGGPFRWARNPIFTFMLLSAAGLCILVPNVLSLASFVFLWTAIELQVRFAEEPHLRRLHGGAYRAYCHRVGRFVPGVGVEH